MSELDIVYDDLATEQQAIYDCIGCEAYCNLVKTYGGLNIYVAKQDTVIRSARDKNIIKDFNGYNFKFLAIKYSLSERTIRQIVQGVREEKQNAPLIGQITFDEI